MSFLCGPRGISEGDRQILAEFGEWLKNQPRRIRPPKPNIIRRPQHCNCGANPLICVAHLEGCTAR